MATGKSQQTFPSKANKFVQLYILRRISSGMDKSQCDVADTSFMSNFLITTFSTRVAGHVAEKLREPAVILNVMVYRGSLSGVSDWWDKEQQGSANIQMMRSYKPEVLVPHTMPLVSKRGLDR